jgi:beta-1,4-N-acetylglucosaminyltransferase
MTRVVFVTVGTTRFDGLVKAVLRPQVQQQLKRKGYEKVVVQFGKSDVDWPSEKGDESSCICYPQIIWTSFVISSDLALPLEKYAFKSSVLSDVASASLVISHGGAGSCLEALEAKRPLIVVVNDSLMNNHQTELAKKLADDGHCAYCANADHLDETIAQFDPDNLKEFPQGDKEAFAQFVDDVVRF